MGTTLACTTRSPTTPATSGAAITSRTRPWRHQAPKAARSGVTHVQTRAASIPLSECLNAVCTTCDCSHGIWQQLHGLLKRWVHVALHSRASAAHARADHCLSPPSLPEQPRWGWREHGHNHNHNHNHNHKEVDSLHNLRAVHLRKHADAGYSRWTNDCVRAYLRDAGLDHVGCSPRCLRILTD